MFSGLLFDVIDRAVKTAMGMELMDMGLSPRQAAEITNYHLIDYAARAFIPEMRRKGYALMPFFAWTAGNALLHFPNILKNPRTYALQHTMAGWWNAQYAPFYGSGAEETPDILSHALAVPQTPGEDGISSWFYQNRPEGQTWLFPELPGGPQLRLMRDIMQNPLNPTYVASKVLKYGTGRSYWSDLLYNAYGVRNKLTSSQGPLDIITGTPGHPGLISQSTWGLRPYKDAFVALLNVYDDETAFDSGHYASAFFNHDRLMDYFMAAMSGLGVPAKQVAGKKNIEPDPIQKIKDMWAKRQQEGGQ